MKSLRDLYQVVNRIDILSIVQTVSLKRAHALQIEQCLMELEEKTK